MAVVTVTGGQATVRLERVARAVIGGTRNVVDTSYEVTVTVTELTRPKVGTPANFEGWCRRHGQAVIFIPDLAEAIADAGRLGHTVRIHSAPPA